MRNTADNFDNYRTIQAKFASQGACGHAIAKGDRIGYNPLLKRVRCASCWRRWEDENLESSLHEQRFEAQQRGGY